MSQAAMKYCAKCVLLGDPWVVWCTKTERFKFLYVIVTKNEYFVQEWMRKKELIENALEESVLTYWPVSLLSTITLP